MWLLSLFLIRSVIGLNEDKGNEYVDPYVPVYSHCDPTPNSEIHQNNGLYYVKPMEDGPIIPAICSNGYTMLDPSMDLDLNSFPFYLSSWDYSRTSLDYIITNLDDTSTFRQWWTPSNEQTRFRVAKDCISCEASLNVNTKNDVVYYTDGSLFCYTIFSAGNPCLQDINEYACNKCDVGYFVDDDDAYYSSYWSSCSALQVSADTPSWHEPQMRVGHHLIYRPVMSLKRDACTCYQFPYERPQQYIVARDELPKVTIVNEPISRDVRDSVDYVDELIIFQNDDKDSMNDDDDKHTKVACNRNVVYLTQNDFLQGTYRIKECGEYIFTQDILLNFNAPSEEEENSPNFSPNTITGDNLYWFPTLKQHESKEYPGLYTYEGTYSLGFFAGIAIECDNVIINLNGFSFGMDKRFYIQQRFFSLIELGAKPFLPNQGASTWGLEGVYYASNVEIKGPGNLRMTSHHGIHGNLAYNIYIHDLNILNFDVAGIGCNGCNYFHVENVVIGPQNDQIPTLGRYTHSRAFIPRLKDLNDRYGDKEIQFYGRPTTTVSDLCQRMVNQMDMIYKNYINGAQYDDDNDEEWIAAKKLFKNPTGWMDGGTSYGIALNGGGAAVVGIGTRISGTGNINIDNVEIFGIYNQVQEKIKFSLSTGTSRGILFDVIDWIALTDQIEDRYNSQYIGSAYQDVQFAAHKFIDSWYYRNSYFVGPEEEQYVFHGNTEETGYPFVTIFPPLSDDVTMFNGCGTDIQLHSSKGAVGMMVSGAQDSTFTNIYIHDVYNWADLGMDICGPYPGPHLTTEDIDIQYGYTGTRAYGMMIDYTTGDYKNIQIENIESYHGEANGLTIYKESYVNLQNLYINNVHAGTQLSDDDVSAMPSLPNLVPRACAVDIHDNTLIDYIDGEDVDNIIFNDIYGFEVCDQFNGNYKDNKLDEDGTLSSLNKDNIYMIIILIVVIFIMFSMVLYFLFRLLKCNCNQHDEIKNEQKQKQHNKSMVAVNEKTPLLPTI